MLLSAWLFSACTGAPQPATDGRPGDTAPWPPGCGDGVLDADEECDDGTDNSDSVADACRTTCFLAHCGDGIVDAGEACDDGGNDGGDGCNGQCVVETGTLEVEPNNEAALATPLVGEGNGSLPEGDVDCWSIDVPACGAMELVETAPCVARLALGLYAPDGDMLASGSPGADGCAHLDPLVAPGARWMEAGTWSACVSATTGGYVPDYSVVLSIPDPLAIGAPASGADGDGDSIPDSCDTDRDGDGLDNDADNCPDVSNGPLTPAPTLTADGYVTTWLSAGPFTGGETTGECRPSEYPFVGEDAALAPTVGDPAGETMWTVALVPSGYYDFLPSYGAASPSREAYTLVYLGSADARTLTLSLGADDGVFVWWNGTQVVDVGSCQGVNADQFQAEVEAEAGWNTLLVKVRDWGGGWGLALRVLDGGAPATGLTPSLAPDTAWVIDQSDRDGDGVGDVCDATPG
jgi:cysteine-rich repeat protein